MSKEQRQALKDIKAELKSKYDSKRVRVLMDFYITLTAGYDTPIFQDVNC